MGLSDVATQSKRLVNRTDKILWIKLDHQRKFTSDVAMAFLMWSREPWNWICCVFRPCTRWVLRVWVRQEKQHPSLPCLSVKGRTWTSEILYRKVGKLNHANTRIFKDYCPQPSSVCSVNSHSENETSPRALLVMIILPVLSAVHADIPELPIKP